MTTYNQITQNKNIRFKYYKSINIKCILEWAVQCKPNLCRVYLCVFYTSLQVHKYLYASCTHSCCFNFLCELKFNEIFSVVNSLEMFMSMSFKTDDNFTTNVYIKILQKYLPISLQINKVHLKQTLKTSIGLSWIFANTQ